VSELIAGCCKVTIETRVYAIDRGNSRASSPALPADRADSELRRTVPRRSGCLRDPAPRLRTHLREPLSVSVTPRAPPLARARRQSSSSRHPDGSQIAIDAMAGTLKESDSALGRLREFGSDLTATDLPPARDLLTTKRTFLPSMSLCGFGFDGRVRGPGDACRQRERGGNWFYASPLGRFSRQAGRALRALPVHRAGSAGPPHRRASMKVSKRDRPDVSAHRRHGVLSRRPGLSRFAKKAGSPYACPISSFQQERRASRRPARSLSLQSPAPCPGNPRLPCDIATQRHDMTLIVTGPFGGKTRLCKPSPPRRCWGNAVFFAPAREAQLAMRKGSSCRSRRSHADQSEGRLGMELIRIRSLFEKLRVGSMVVPTSSARGPTHRRAKRSSSWW